MNNKLIFLQDLGTMYPNENSKTKRRYGLYKCFCEKEFKAQITKVKNKITKSCGCREGNIKHKLYNHRLYRIWANIKDRCTNEKSKHFINYGAKSITIYDEWKNDFMSFYNWAIKNGYGDDLTIDRIDNDKGYNPDNCRWTIKTIQARNTKKLRTNNTSDYRGVYFNKTANKWQSQIVVNCKKIYLGIFNTALEGAKAYDKYVLDNNLEHTLNLLPEGQK